MGQSLKTMKKVCTIWLDAEIGEGGYDKDKMFFCFNCRVPLIEYSGNVMSAVPGKAPYEPSTVLKCKGSVRNGNGEWMECGMYYVFKEAVYTKNLQMT